MQITKLNNRPNDDTTDAKANKLYDQFGTLLSELEKKQLPPNIMTLVNNGVDQINASPATSPQFAKLIKQQQTLILKQIEKELKIVPKNYYRNLWMVLGLSVFGLPIGVAFGLSLKNMGMLGVGLPIGMAIGIVVGTAMDKKTAKQGRQLELEIRY